MRELWDAYHERKRVLGEIAACQMSCLVWVMTGQKIEPEDQIGRAVRQPRRCKSEAERERESQMAWKLLDRFFTGKG
jgi:hypothetical protein